MEIFPAFLFIVIGFGCCDLLWLLYGKNSGRSTGSGIDAGAKGYQYGQRARKEQFRQQLDARLGAPQSGGALDYAILEAQRQAPLLRRLVREELPRTIKLCVYTHRLAALAAEAECIYEIALEPECFALRERVVSVGTECVERLQNYPLLTEEPKLMQNLIVVRGQILPCCRDCPYLRHRTYIDPPLCPTAIVAGIKPEEVGEDEIND